MSDDAVRYRLMDYATKGVHVLLALTAFLATTMLSDIRGELRTLSAAMQDLVVRTAGIEQRVVVLERGADEGRERMDRMDADWRQFWRERGDGTSTTLRP